MTFAQVIVDDINRPKEDLLYGQNTIATCDRQGGVYVSEGQLGRVVEAVVAKVAAADRHRVNESAFRAVLTLIAGGTLTHSECMMSAQGALDAIP